MGQATSNHAEAENLAIKIREYAEAALEYFSSSQDDGKRYELVEHGLMARGLMMDHFDRLDFKAKEKDCPSAPVETFFAQLSFVPHMRIDSCVRLGPSQELPSVV